MSYIALASQTLSTNASSVTFSSIPTSASGKTLRDLVLVINAATPQNGVVIGLRFNSDSGANYSFVHMVGTGSQAQTATGGSQTSLQILHDGSGNGFMSTAQIFEYSTSKHKSVLARSNAPFNLTSGTTGRWANTAAITSITIVPSSGNFYSGNTFSLYGIEG